MSWQSRRSAWIAALLPLLSPVPLAAQGWREAQLFVVAAGSEPAQATLGIGLAWRDPRRARAGIAIATGTAEGGRAAGRAELTAHFLLDPDRRRGAAVYGGGGLALTMVERDRARAWVQLALGVEWNPAGNGGVFLEAGVGGGARLAAGCRIRKRNAPIR